MVPCQGLAKDHLGTVVTNLLPYIFPMIVLLCHAAIHLFQLQIVLKWSPSIRLCGTHYIIDSVQTLVSRETSPLGSLVISVTKQAAGEGANNVIPDFATFGGTLRCLSTEHLLSVRDRINQVSAFWTMHAAPSRCWSWCALQILQAICCSCCCTGMP